MKNYIKMITLLGIVTSFSAAYTMEETYAYGLRLQDEAYESENKNPLLHANNFSIKASYGYPAWKPVSDGNPICTTEGLVPVVAGYALLAESDDVKKEKILKMVHNTVGGGMPLTCNYIVKQNSGYSSCILFQPSRNPIPVFQSIENLFGDLLAGGASSLYGMRNKILLIQAILQGCDERKKNIIRMCDILIACAHDELKAKIPKELAFLIASYLPKCYTSTEDEELIEQARKKLNEAKSLLLNLEEEEQDLQSGRGIGQNAIDIGATDTWAWEKINGPVDPLLVFKFSSMKEK